MAQRFAEAAAAATPVTGSAAARDRGRACRWPTSRSPTRCCTTATSRPGAGLVDFAVNVHPEPRPAWMEAALRDGVQRSATYPDATPARDAIAELHHRRPDEVLVTAGAAEAFELIARWKPWRHAVVVHPQFTEPHAALERAGHQVTVVHCRPEDGYRLDAGAVPEDADLVILGNPTNPTGVLHPAEEILKLRRPKRVVVVDEAFMDAVVDQEPVAGRGPSPRPAGGAQPDEALVDPRHPGRLRARQRPGRRGARGAKQVPWSVSAPAIAAGARLHHRRGRHRGRRAGPRGSGSGAPSWSAHCSSAASRCVGSRDLVRAGPAGRTARGRRCAPTASPYAGPTPSRAWTPGGPGSPSVRRRPRPTCCGRSTTYARTPSSRARRMSAVVEAGPGRGAAARVRGRPALRRPAPGAPGGGLRHRRRASRTAAVRRLRGRGARVHVACWWVGAPCSASARTAHPEPAGAAHGASRPRPPGRCWAGAAWSVRRSPSTASSAEDDLDGARHRLTYLVGRDTSALSADEIARAVVESVAENTSDAVTAPLVWGAVAGVPGLLAHRASNTLDAMVGYRNARYERFGWASARLDDLLNLPGSRLGGLGASWSPSRGTHDWPGRRGDGTRPATPAPTAAWSSRPSPEPSGSPLGGTNRYGDRVEHRPTMGDGPAPRPLDVPRSTALARRVGAVAVVATALVACSCGVRSPDEGSSRTRRPTRAS